MLSDIVSYQRKKGVFDVQWRSSPEMADEDVLGTMMELMKKDKLVRGNLKRSLDIDTDSDLNDFLEDFKSDAISQGFLRIDSYTNITAALNLAN